MRKAKLVAVLVVAGVAGYVSYWHMHDLALAVGEGRVQAKILPLSVDGMMLAATLTAVERRRDKAPVGFWCWLGLGLGLTASTAANIAAAEPTVEGRLVAMWPPLALFVCLELLFTDSKSNPKPRPAPTPTAKPDPTSKPVNGTRSSRVDVLLPEARRIQDTHGKPLTRDALKVGLAGLDPPETAGTSTLVKLLDRLREDS